LFPADHADLRRIDQLKTAVICTKHFTQKPQSQPQRILIENICENLRDPTSLRLRRTGLRETNLADLRRIDQLKTGVICMKHFTQKPQI